jgi:CysZ protein
MLARERQLWAPALVPFLLSLAAIATALGLVAAYSGELHGWATDWMPALEAARWYAWLWIGPAKLALWLLGIVLFLVIVAASLVAAYLVASLLASPFHDVLAARVERIVTGAVVDTSESGALGTAREALRALVEEARRLAFFLAVAVPLVVVGILAPFAQIVTSPALVAFTIFFLPLDYASYTLDRRRVSFAEKRRWLWSQRAATLGFGAAAFLTCLVPVLNLLAMPILVVAGTLLALRHQPDPASTSR